MNCPHWDCGWCYATGSKYNNGCVGKESCEYMQDEIPRIDLISQNGATGEHYMVEKIARIMAGKDADMKLDGKNIGKLRWELYVPVAIKVMEALDE